MDDLENEGAAAPADDTSHVETTSDAAPQATTEQAAADASIDDTLRAIYEKNNPQRGSDGRFAKSVQDQSPTEGAEKQAQDASAIPVPQSWSADVKAKWDTLPSDVKAYVAKREQEAHEYISRQGQQIKAYEPAISVLEQGRQTFDKYGMQPEEGVAQLLRANEYLERDAPSAIRDLARAYGVDLRTLAGLQPGNGASPDTNALLNRIAQLEGHLNETSNRVSHREQQEQQRAVATVETQIADFAKDKPDFQELESDIEREIFVIKQASPDLPPSKILETAYDRARWANPTSRQKAIEAETKAAEAKRLEEAKKRSTDAKRVSPLNVRASHANASAPRSIDDDLREIANRHYS